MDMHPTFKKMMEQDRPSIPAPNRPRQVILVLFLIFSVAYFSRGFF